MSRLAELTALMDRIVTPGRSTPGAAQPNDVPVNWKRFMQPKPEPKKPAKKNNDPTKC